MTRTAPALTAAQMTAWRTFLGAHSAMVRALEAELAAAHDLPLTWYDVLVQLAATRRRQLRMTELAERVLLSRSGLTRLVDRLEREGLVERQACPSDARGTLAVLTPAGLDRLRAASPTHLGGVAAYFQRLSEPEVRQLTALLDRLVPGSGRQRTDD